jgi:hypothetical protein
MLLLGIEPSRRVAKVNHYRIKYSDENGTHNIIKSTQFSFEDAEDWAEYQDQSARHRQYFHGREQTNQQIQVWQFEEVTGIGAVILSFLKGG